MPSFLNFFFFFLIFSTFSLFFLSTLHRSVSSLEHRDLYPAWQCLPLHARYSLCLTSPSPALELSPPALTSTPPLLGHTIVDFSVFVSSALCCCVAADLTITQLRHLEKGSWEIMGRPSARRISPLTPCLPALAQNSVYPSVCLSYKA